MAKASIDKFIIALFVILIGIIVLFFYNTLHSKKILEAQVVDLSDSLSTKIKDLERGQYNKFYISQLLDVSLTENNKQANFDTIDIYELNDVSKGAPKSFRSLLDKERQNMFIRYTEVGCNSCADSTFKLLQQYVGVGKKFDIVVLVDFTNQDAYLKWRKFTKFSYPVYWIAKGDLPFKMDHENQDYIFSTNGGSMVNDFFVPNSKFPEFIHYYFSTLESKNL